MSLAEAIGSLDNMHVHDNVTELATSYEFPEILQAIYPHAQLKIR
jgi:hypothetical protein